MFGSKVWRLLPTSTALSKKIKHKVYESTVKHSIRREICKMEFYKSSNMHAYIVFLLYYCTEQFSVPRHFISPLPVLFMPIFLDQNSCTVPLQRYSQSFEIILSRLERNKVLSSPQKTLIHRKQREENKVFNFQSYMHVFDGHQHLPDMLRGEWELNKSDNMILWMY